MLGQILTEAMSHIQLITAGLLFTVAVLELIHIGQTSRINRKLSRAGRWLQRYLNTVFREETEDEPDRTETERRTSPEKRTGRRTGRNRGTAGSCPAVKEQAGRKYAGFPGA